jgi:hypothetical protein
VRTWPGLAFSSKRAGLTSPENANASDKIRLNAVRRTAVESTALLVENLNFKYRVKFQASFKIAPVEVDPEVKKV